MVPTPMTYFASSIIWKRKQWKLHYQPYLLFSSNETGCKNACDFIWLLPVNWPKSCGKKRISHFFIRTVFGVEFSRTSLSFLHNKRKVVTQSSKWNHWFISMCKKVIFVTLPECINISGCSRILTVYFSNIRGWVKCLWFCA